MATRDSPDIYALARGPQARGCGHIYQANPSWPWYNYYICTELEALSYSTVVLYIGIMKVRKFRPEIITPRPARYLLSNSLGIMVRYSKAQKCLQTLP